MIIKNLRISQNSKYRIKSLVKYILLDGQKEISTDFNPYEPFLILNHIKTLDIGKIHKEFLTNDLYRKKRKNGVCYYHEVLAIAPEDEKYVTDSMLEDLAKQYIKIRGAENALVLAKAHKEKSHRHIHVLISGTKYKSDETLRLDDENFKRVRLEMETYQKKVYPQLSHSLVYLDKENQRRNKKRADKNRRAENELQLKQRIGNKTPTKKESLKKRIDSLLESATTPKGFLKAIIAEKDLELYAYKQNITGVIFEGKKYRFLTLGVDKEKLKTLREQARRLDELKQILSSENSRALGS